MKKRIAYFTPDCYLDVDLPVISQLAKSFEIDWFVLYTYTPGSYKYSAGEVRDFAAIHGVRVRVYTRKYRLRSALNLPLITKMFLQIRKSRSHLVYFTAEDDIYFSFLAMAFLPVSRTVKGVHNVVPHEKYDSFLKTLPHNLLRKRFRYFHFFSNLQAEYFHKKFRPADSFVARLCLNHKQPQDIFKYKEKEFTQFIYFGKITYYKGVDILIKAANKLAQENKDFKLTIAGRCDDWQPYSKLIKQNGNIDVNIRMISNAELQKYIKQSHFVLLPYRSVTQSGVITVYYNSYIPAITSNLDGFKEYVTDEVNGLTFQSEDVDSLYQVMKKAVNMKEKEYNSIRENLKLFTEAELNPKKIAEKYSHFFNSVIAGKNTSF